MQILSLGTAHPKEKLLGIFLTYLKHSVGSFLCLYAGSLVYNMSSQTCSPDSS